jgi:CheY-like chemotaxis protein
MTKTILIVDDEPGIVEALKTGLERQVTNFSNEPLYLVLTARDGEEGLAMFREHKPDIVITDWQMPKMEGPQLIEAMKAERPDVPVILTSGRDLKELKGDADASAFLDKFMTSWVRGKQGSPEAYTAIFCPKPLMSGVALSAINRLLQPLPSVSPTGLILPTGFDPNAGRDTVRDD